MADRIPVPDVSDSSFGEFAEAQAESLLTDREIALASMQLWASIAEIQQLLLDEVRGLRADLRAHMARPA